MSAWEASLSCHKSISQLLNLEQLNLQIHGNTLKRVALTYVPLQGEVIVQNVKHFPKELRGRCYLLPSLSFCLQVIPADFHEQLFTALERVREGSQNQLLHVYATVGRAIDVCGLTVGDQEHETSAGMIHFSGKVITLRWLVCRNPRDL